MRARTFRSFAKINLGLEVVGRRPDGYHDLKTIFATLSLHDLVTLSPRKSGVTVRCDHRLVPTDETNLAHRAAVLMQRMSGRGVGVAIDIRKRIAVGGGLGGGSSNAATVLRALDLVWGTGLGPSGLTEAARTLGADVPYFLFGGPALGLGRGDLIEPIDIPAKGKVLLVPGSGGVSTADVFRRFATIGRRLPGTSRIDAYLRSHQGPRIPRNAKPLSSLRNDLERAAIDISEPLADTARLVRRTGRATGALHTAMSGSGSSFFLMFEDSEARRLAALALRASGRKAISCSLLSRSEYARRFEV